MKHAKTNLQLLEILTKWATHYGVSFSGAESSVINSACQEFIVLNSCEFKKGDLIMKANRKHFNHSNAGEKTLSITIESITRTNNAQVIIINKFYSANLNDLVLVTPEEVKKYEDLWEQGNNISIIRKNGEFTHIREDNRNEKLVIPKNRVKNVLYEMNIKYPDAKFEAYICDVCNGIHIGKTSHLIE